MTREDLIWRWTTALAIGVLAAVVGAAYVALILAEAGIFRLLPCLAAAAGIGALAAGIGFRRRPMDSRAGKAGWCLAALIALGTLVLTTPPSEMILGGWDPGVYVHTAAAIATHGSLQMPADDIAALPQTLKPGLTRNVGGWMHPFPGIFPLPNGRFSPQFMHLYPSLLAVGYGLAGVWGALAINPLLNVLAILAMYGFASKVVGRGWGLAAALLLALNPAQIWQAKFATAEVLVQVLLLTGLSAFLDFTRRAAILPAVIAGALFGLSFFTRYDTVLTLVPLVLLLVVLRAAPEYRRSVFAFLLVLALFALHAGWHMTVVAPCYRPLPGLVFPLLLKALVLGAVALACLQFPFGRRLASLATRHPVPIRVCLSLGFVAFLFFAGYVRPHLRVDGRVLHTVQAFLDAIGQPCWIIPLTGGANARNASYLVAMFGRLGLLLGCGGILTMIWRTRDRGTAIWLLATTATTMLLVTNVFHDHFMMWVSRRFIPVVVPLLTIGMAACAQEIHRHVQRWRRPPALFLSIGLLAGAAALSLPKTLRTASVRDWPGLCAWTEKLAQAVPSNTIVFCDEWGFAAPLRFLHGIEAHEVCGGIDCATFIRDNTDSIRSLGKAIWVLSKREQTAVPGIRFRRIVSQPLDSQILSRTRLTIPTGLWKQGGPFALYAVEFADPGPTRRVEADQSHVPADAEKAQTE
jgi:hypothetical protein